MCTKYNWESQNHKIHLETMVGVNLNLILLHGKAGNYDGVYCMICSFSVCIAGKGEILEHQQ